MKFDEALAAERGLTWERDGGLLRIKIPGHTGDVHVIVKDSGELGLVPERSHHHRALIAALGPTP